jgi:hypothetical protein
LVVNESGALVGCQEDYSQAATKKSPMMTCSMHWYFYRRSVLAAFSRWALAVF